MFNLLRKKRYQPSNQSGGGTILDQVFGPAWNGDITGRSANSIYDKIISIGAGFGNTAFVRASGNDSTAILGNILQPFLTIGAAVTALGSSSGLLSVDSGVYNLFDADSPYGLKAPNSNYDVYLSPGCTINYYGTYGLFSSDYTSTGNLYGYGKFVTISSTFSHSGYALSMTGVIYPPYMEFDRIDCQSSSVTSNCLQLGDSTGFGGTCKANRITARGGIGINIPLNSLWEVYIPLIVGTSSVAPLINLDNNGSSFYNAFFGNCKIQLQATGASDTIIKINKPTSAGAVQFDNCRIVNFSANRNSFVKIIHSGSADVMFSNCTLKDNASSTESFASALASAMKIINTYATKNASVNITNNISGGVGLVVSSGL